MRVQLEAVLVCGPRSKSSRHLAVTQGERVRVPSVQLQRSPSWGPVAQPAEHQRDMLEVVGSSPTWIMTFEECRRRRLARVRSSSSAGRAPASHAGGRGIEAHLDHARGARRLGGSVVRDTSPLRSRRRTARRPFVPSSPRDVEADARERPGSPAAREGRPVPVLERAPLAATQRGRVRLPPGTSPLARHPTSRTGRAG